MFLSHSGTKKWISDKLLRIDEKSILKINLFHVKQQHVNYMFYVFLWNV